jgi:hypothetical protein
MPETPEIPEAKDPFEKRAAVTIAILAVVLAVFGNKAENARTEAIIKTNEASNQWAYFQAKGIKGSIASSEERLLKSLPPSQDATAIPKSSGDLLKEVERYKTEQEGIKQHAEKAEKDASHELEISKRCERASLALQIAIVIASVSILARSHAFWIASIVLGLVGVGAGMMAFLM